MKRCSSNLYSSTAAIFFAAVLFILLACGLCGCSSLTTVFRHYLRQYPEAHLQDVYKWCFQNVYGPGHLIVDSTACARNILSEISQMRFNDTFPDYEPCGPDGRYVRVNLRLIRDSIIPLPLFVNALIASASTSDTLPLSCWIQQWHGYCHTLSTQHPRPQNFATDSIAIDSLLSSGKYVFHHSRHFDDCYDPHYRIIRYDIFVHDLLPLLRKKR